MRYPNKFYITFKKKGNEPKSTKQKDGALKFFQKYYEKTISIARSRYDFRSGIFYVVTNVTDFTYSFLIELTRSDIIEAAKLKKS